jgi:predicted nuclease with TOPRIM domain
LREQLRARLEELRREFETGQARLQELETQATRLRETLLRISGAIQVLEEMQEAGAGEAGPDTPAAEASSTH